MCVSGTCCGRRPSSAGPVVRLGSGAGGGGHDAAGEPVGEVPRGWCAIRAPGCRVHVEEGTMGARPAGGAARRRRRAARRRSHTPSAVIRLGGSPLVGARGHRARPHHTGRHPPTGTGSAGVSRSPLLPAICDRRRPRSSRPRRRPRAVQRILVGDDHEAAADAGQRRDLGDGGERARRWRISRLPLFARGRRRRDRSVSAALSSLSVPTLDRPASPDSAVSCAFSSTHTVSTFWRAGSARSVSADLPASARQRT